MPKFKNVSGKDFNVLMRGRRISIPKGSIVEGPDSLKIYSSLKEVSELEYDKYVKHMPKFLKANPMHKLRAFINSNSNSSEYAMQLQEKPIIPSNMTNSLDTIVYAETYPKSGKPPVFVLVNSSNKENIKTKITSISKYPNINFINSESEMPNTPNTLVIQIDDPIVFDFDFVTLIARYSFNNKVVLPRPFILSDITEKGIKDLIKTHKIKRDVHITIATLVHNIEQYRNFVTDLSQQHTDYKFEVIMMPNFNNEFTSCAEPLNIALDLADGIVVNLCHQDLRVNTAWVEAISNHVTRLSRDKIKWGVLGMAGAFKYGKAYTPNVDANVLYLSDTTTTTKKSFAAIYREVYGNYKEVQTLDELSLIMKKDSPFRFDEKTFDHYHWYGADLCLQAMSMGYKNFAIDADCLHLSDGQGNLSGGHVDAYVAGGVKLFKKWAPYFPYFKTTTGMFLINEKLFIPLIFMLINRKNNNKNLPEIIKVS